MYKASASKNFESYMAKSNFNAIANLIGPTNIQRTIEFSNRTYSSNLFDIGAPLGNFPIIMP